MKEFCPKCGKKEFESSGCTAKWRCHSCNYFLMNSEFQKLKKMEQSWILIRDGEVRNTFKNRREAVKHFKELLKQTLNDFEKQDKTDEYDYPMKIPETEIKPVEERKSYLSLL